MPAPGASKPSLGHPERLKGRGELGNATGGTGVRIGPDRTGREVERREGARKIQGAGGTRLGEPSSPSGVRRGKGARIVPRGGMVRSSLVWWKMLSSGRRWLSARCLGDGQEQAKTPVQSWERDQGWRWSLGCSQSTVATGAAGVRKLTW